MFNCFKKKKPAVTFDQMIAEVNAQISEKKLEMAELEMRREELQTQADKCWYVQLGTSWQDAAWSMYEAGCTDYNMIANRINNAYSDDESGPEANYDRVYNTIRRYKNKLAK